MTWNKERCIGPCRHMKIKNKEYHTVQSDEIVSLSYQQICIDMNWSKGRRIDIFRNTYMLGIVLEFTNETMNAAISLVSLWVDETAIVNVTICVDSTRILIVFYFSAIFMSCNCCDNYCIWLWWRYCEASKMDVTTVYTDAMMMSFCLWLSLQSPIWMNSHVVKMQC